MSSPIMSLSGTRAVIGESFDPKMALEMAMAFGQIRKGSIVVGGDTRQSHDMVKGCIISGLLSVGASVIDIGKVTTPTLQQAILHHKAAGGIVITASHNPIMWNGLKLMNHTGSFLDNQEYAEYMTVYQSKSFQLVSYDKLGTVKDDLNAVERHVNKIISTINIDVIRQANLKVLIDANFGAGAVANPVLLDKLGVQYDMIGAEPNGLFDHDPEPLEKNLSALKVGLKQGVYDIGFAQDADADRLVILDENGCFIGEDYSLAYCMDYVLSKEAHNQTEIVVNLSTSLIIDYLAKKYDVTLHHTKIGESNVTQKMKACHALVGGEGNGGVIYPKVGWGRDSLVGMTIALKHLAESKKTVSETISSYPKYLMFRDKFTVTDQTQVQSFLDKMDTLFPNATVNKEDGVKILLDDAWVHARPSNTEPIIRLFIEAKSSDTIASLREKISES